jgi:uncharacterized membrane protein HdeD (DUF308 family)
MAIALPVVTLAAVVLAFGAYATIEGISCLIALFRGGHRDDRWLLLLEAIIGIGVGVVTLRTPGITATVLIFFIAIWALATGVLRIVEGIRLRREISGETWLILGGVASIVFALLVMMRPLVGALALIQVIGIYAVILGVTEIMLSFRLRRVGRTIERTGVWDPTQRRAA